MKKVFLSLLLIGLVIGLVFTGCAKPAPTLSPTPIPTPTFTPTATPTPTPTPSPSPTPVTQPIVWKVATFLPRQNYSVKNMHPIVEQAKQRSNGQLIIQYLGGPEVIPGVQQAEAVRKGVIQMSIVPCAYYEGMVSLGNMLSLTQLTAVEERASGAYDFINELHKKVGLFYLERAESHKVPSNFCMILKQPIEKPQQLAGKKIGGSSTATEPIVKAMGASLTIVPLADAYTALERGVTDGSNTPLSNIVDYQLYAVSKYAISHLFLAPGATIIVNLDSWNKLPPNLQTMMTDIAKEAIVEFTNANDAVIAAARQKLTDNGVKFIEFSSEDVDWFYKIVYDSSWADAEKRYPEVAAKLRPMLTKK